jgi:pimeloyl-ACP methyl ester carboxylesterase
MNEQGMGLTPKELGEEPKELGQSGTKSFETEGGTVEVTWKAFEPEVDLSKEVGQPSDHVIIFMPGVGMDAESSAVEGLTQHLANYGKMPAMSVSSRREQVELGDQDDLMHQADAIRQMLEAKGVKELTIVSNSLAGSKSIDLAYLLQIEHPDVKIQGLILLGPAGLYEQEGDKIAGQFFKDSMVKMPWSIVKDTAKGMWQELRSALSSAYRREAVPRWDIKKVLEPGVDVAKGIRKEIMRSGLREFFKRLRQEGVNAGKVNERAAAITAPIVLVQAIKDSVFKWNELLPVEAQKKGVKAQQLRRAALKKKIFALSESLVVLLVEKLGYHGVPYFRDEQVVNVALYMLKREQQKRAAEQAAELAKLKQERKEQADELVQDADKVDLQPRVLE